MAYVIELLALAVWVGGLVVIIGAIIPAVFNSFNMEAGGRFLTRVFEGYNRLVLAAMGATGGAFALRAVLLWKGGLTEVLPSRTEAILFGMMVAVATVIVFVLEPETIVLQEDAFRVKEATARKAAYEAFFRLHMVVRGLYLLNLGLGISLIIAKLRTLVHARYGPCSHELS
jgi:uncharacterized membrane protein